MFFCKFSPDLCHFFPLTNVSLLSYRKAEKSVLVVYEIKQHEWNINKSNKQKQGRFYATLFDKSWGLEIIKLIYGLWDIWRQINAS